MNLQTDPLTIGFSTCPNDTFIFYALMHDKIKECRLRFRETLADVETLNKMAFNRQLDISKLSYHAFGHLVDDYVLLPSGSALGQGCGPLLISNRPRAPEDLTDKKIAIPGEYTTAAMLLRLYNNRYKQLEAMSFEQIMPAIKEGAVEAGVIIHESRFTYQKEGFIKIVDLGDWWEEKTGLPIPLGGIFAKRSLSKETIKAIAFCLKESVKYAFRNPDAPMGYAKEHAQELADDVIRQHIGLYVNSFTIELGEEGIEAVRYMLKMGQEKGIFKKYRDDFVI